MLTDVLSIALAILLLNEDAQTVIEVEDFCNNSEYYADEKWYQISSFARQTDGSYKFNASRLDDSNKYFGLHFSDNTISQDCQWCFFADQSQISTSRKYKIGQTKLSDYLDNLKKNTKFSIRTGKLCLCPFGALDLTVFGSNYCYYPIFTEKTKEMTNYFNKSQHVLKIEEKGDKTDHEFGFIFYPSDDGFNPNNFIQLYDTVRRGDSLNIVINNSTKNKLIAYNASNTRINDFFYLKYIKNVKYAFEIKNSLITKIVTNLNSYDFNKNNDYGFLVEGQNLSKEIQAEYFTNISVAKNLSYLCFVRQGLSPKILSDYYCQAFSGNLTAEIYNSKSDLIHLVYGEEFGSVQKHYRPGDIYVQLQKSATPNGHWKLIDSSEKLSLKSETELIVIVDKKSAYYQTLTNPPVLKSCEYEVDSHFVVSGVHCWLNKNGI